jgi:hypothetical protein
MLLAAALIYQLAIMPTGQKTPENKELFKPFSVEETFVSLEQCHSAAKATLKAHLQMRGLPPGTTANYSCTAKIQN